VDKNEVVKEGAKEMHGEAAIAKKNN